MSNFALTTWIILLFIFAAGLALGSLARGFYDRGKLASRGGEDRPVDKA